MNLDGCSRGCKLDWRPQAGAALESRDAHNLERNWNEC